MYTKLYKRSAEKWQKVTILQKTQKSKKVYILSGPFMVHTNRKDAILGMYFALFWDALVDIF